MNSRAITGEHCHLLGSANLALLASVAPWSGVFSVKQHLHAQLKPPLSDSAALIGPKRKSRK
jgi:hypothetical protein